MKQHRLERLFSPRSIAVVGASRTPHKLGYDVLQNVSQFGFSGKIHPVNPSAKKILGLPCTPSVLDIVGSVDVAIIMVPASLVASVLEECGKKKIPFAVIISAGFSETGSVGKKAEDEITRIAQRYGIRIVGPNCLGYIHTKKRLNASFAEGMPQKGSIGFLSQSGAMGVALLDWAYTAHVGFSKIISIGNKADISEIELLEYFAQDPDTKMIMMYLESINNGRAFMKIAASIAKTKPIILLKAGNSEKGKKAIASHTGSLAGSAQVLQAVCERTGIIQAHTIEEFFDFALAYSVVEIPEKNRTVILTNAGGPGIMAVDAAEGSNLSLQTVDTKSQKKLRTVLPAAASTKNPVDIIGDANAERYHKGLEIILQSPAVDSVLVILTPQIMTEEIETARSIIQLQKKYNKPIVTSFMGGREVAAARTLLQKNGIPNYETPERAIRVLSSMALYGKRRRETLFSSTEKMGKKKLPDAENHPQIRTREAEDILQHYGIPVVQSQHIATISECEKIKNFPIVMKVASRDIIHKAASGAIVINITTISQAKKAFVQIQKSLSQDQEFEGVLIQPFIQKKPACELFIGMKRDPSFGPVIVCGIGGSSVEIYKDVQYSITPLSFSEAKKAIKGLRGFSLLQSYDQDFFARMIVRVATIAADYPEITELDINPLVLYSKEGVVLDTRIMIV